ncbi:MAG: hypothetical protein ACFCVF_13845 [Kineosporiaceae bacterium]
MIGITTSTDRRAAKRHRIGFDGLAGLLPAVLDTGVVLGVAAGRGRQICQFFDLRGPTSAVAVGPLELGQHIVFRTLGLGAVVTVRTTRPRAWGQLATAVNLPRDLLAILPAAGQVSGQGTASRPHLVVDDAADRPAGPSGDGGSTASGRWQCDLWLVEDVSRAAVEAARAADTVLVRPAGIPGAGPLAAACGIDEPILPADGRGDRDVAVFRGGAVRWLTLPESPVEAVPLRRASVPHLRAERRTEQDR